MPIMKFQSPEGNTISVDSPDGSIPSEQELDSLFKVEPVNKKSENPQSLESNSSGVQDQNILGQVFNVPGAAIRSMIQGTGYTKGATNPDSIPTFQQQSLNYPISNRPDQPVQNFTKGLIRDTAGYIADTVTNPANILAQIVGVGSANTVSKLLTKSPKQLISKAEKLTTEILQPTKGELANAIANNRPLPAVKEAAKVIKKSKDYAQLQNNIDDAIKSNFTERNNILKSDNYNINGDQYISNLKHEIISLENQGQANPSEIMQMKQVLGREQAFIAKSGGKIDRLTAQARKEELQNMTESLLVKNAKGQNISTEPARTRALDALRFGLKEAVEGGDSRVSELNSTYAGLKRAKELVAAQNAILQKTVKQTLAQKLINMATNPKDATFQAFKRAQSLSSKTSQIENIIGKVK